MHISVANRDKSSPQRVRRKLVRVVILDPNNPTPPRRDGRRNPHGWRFANKARRLKGLELAEKMRRLRVAGYPVDVIAAYFGTTRAAVYQRLYRLRSQSSHRLRSRASESGSSLICFGLPSLCEKPRHERRFRKRLIP